MTNSSSNTLSPETRIKILQAMTSKIHQLQTDTSGEFTDEPSDLARATGTINHALVDVEGTLGEIEDLWPEELKDVFGRLHQGYIDVWKESQVQAKQAESFFDDFSQNLVEVLKSPNKSSADKKREISNFINKIAGSNPGTVHSEKWRGYINELVRLNGDESGANSLGNCNPDPKVEAFLREKAGLYEGVFRANETIQKASSDNAGLGEGMLALDALYYIAPCACGKVLLAGTEAGTGEKDKELAAAVGDKIDFEDELLAAEREISYQIGQIFSGDGHWQTKQEAIMKHMAEVALRHSKKNLDAIYVLLGPILGTLMVDLSELSKSSWTSGDKVMNAKLDFLKAAYGATAKAIGVYAKKVRPKDCDV